MKVERSRMRNWAPYLCVYTCELPHNMHMSTGTTCNKNKIQSGHRHLREAFIFRSMPVQAQWAHGRADHSDDQGPGLFVICVLANVEQTEKYLFHKC